MTLHVFDRNDQAFFEWTTAHPNGLFANTWRSAERYPYFVLHRSGCSRCSPDKRHQSESFATGGFTERDFIKVCSESLHALAAWGAEHRDLGGQTFTQVCKSCQPIDPDTLVRLQLRGEVPSANQTEPLAEEVDEAQAEELTEGAFSQILVNAYERNPTARRLCLEAHGTTCKVCSFDFEKVYGSHGRGFIHVHHVKPLHEIGETYTVDPEQDLVPVCPNCHAMLHRGEKVLSLEALRSLMMVEQ